LTYTKLAADIVAAYVANNHVEPAELPNFIRSIHSAVAGIASPHPLVPDEPTSSTKAQIRKSISPDGLISFIDGKSYKMLKRHLTKHGMRPDDYRERFGLPSDYPMVSADYAAARSGIAKNAGLGRKPRPR
jgi:predicted transcriptional regulator